MGTGEGMERWILTATARAPTNIAVIKYWGKRDETLILPLNENISVALDLDHLSATTTVAVSPSFQSDRMWLNGKEISLSGGRFQTCLREIRRRGEDFEDEKKGVCIKKEDWQRLHVHIASFNNFPTAAGLASSAAGFACLVFSLAKMMNLKEDCSQLSAIARQGSGSACRSLYGGFVKWIMGNELNGADSLAVQLVDETHWDDIVIIIAVVSSRQKDTSSTSGMRDSVETSTLLQYRAKTIVPKRMVQMEEAIKTRDFASFAKLTCADSNQFHAVCLDTTPPIFYMNNTSHRIINFMERWNRNKGTPQGLERWLWVMAMVFLICFFSSLEAREIESRRDYYSQIYNHTVATILVEYASAVYISDLTELFTWTCSRCNDKIKAFEIVSLIVDVKSCLQAFVGVDENLNSIIVAFRGTQEHSIQNWIEDLFWKQLDLNYPGMPDAMVHQGFYYAYHNTTMRDGILDGVQRAKNLYGNIGIIVTGHSMGGAIASFCALDLAFNHKVQTIQLMTFGQPRIGNEIFSSYFSEHVPHTVRVTNRHDMVPHLPPYYYFFPSKTYHHFPREVWIYDIILGSLVYEAEKICDGSGEDPTCSRSVSGNSLTDHLCYFGVNLEAETWRACNIVLNIDTPNLHTDHNGNFVVYKDTSSPSFIRSPMENYISIHS